MKGVVFLPVPFGETRISNHVNSNKGFNYHDIIALQTDYNNLQLFLNKHKLCSEFRELEIDVQKYLNTMHEKKTVCFPLHRVVQKHAEGFHLKVHMFSINMSWYA